MEPSPPSGPMEPSPELRSSDGPRSPRRPLLRPPVQRGSLQELRHARRQGVPRPRWQGPPDAVCGAASTRRGTSQSRPSPDHGLTRGARGSTSSLGTRDSHGAGDGPTHPATDSPEASSDRQRDDLGRAPATPRGETTRRAGWPIATPFQRPPGNLSPPRAGHPQARAPRLIRIRLEMLNGDLITDNGTGLFHPTGSWQVQIDIPEGVQPGDYQLRVTCSDPDTSFGPVTFTVTAPVPPTVPEVRPTPVAAEPVPAQPLVAPPVFTG
jgi:hypothetical protein